MTDDRTKARCLCHRDNDQGFSNCTNLIEFDENCIRCTNLDSMSKSLWIGNIQIVTDNLYSMPFTLSEFYPRIPVILTEWIFD